MQKKGSGTYEEASCERDAALFEVVAAPAVGVDVEAGAAGVADEDGVAEEGAEGGDEL